MSRWALSGGATVTKAVMGIMVGGVALSLSGCGGGSSAGPVTSVSGGYTPAVGTTLTQVRGTELETVSVTGSTFTHDATGNNTTLETLTNGVRLTTPDGDTVDFLNSAADTSSGYTSWDQTVSAGGTHTVLAELHGDESAFGASSGKLQYSAFGEWEEYDNTVSPTVLTSVGVFSTGDKTAGADMPTTGTATYTGLTKGVADVSGTNYFITGNAQLTADFAANTISGGLTGLNAVDPGTSTTVGSVNDVDFTAGTITGTTFAGTAAASATAGAVDISGTTGTFGGQFYGTGTAAAAEAGGTYQISNGTGTTIIGSFGTAK